MKFNFSRFCASTALLMLLSVAAPAADAEPRYRELPNFHRVNARLYRGAQPLEGGLKRLRELGVETIINLRGADARVARERAEALALGLKYYNVALPGHGRPKNTDVEEILRIVDDPASGVVFVHCHHGRDRTGTIVACYRIAQEHWTSAQATREARHYGMSIFQFRMRRYIRSFDERRGSPPHNAAQQSIETARSAALYSTETRLEPI